MAMSDELKLNVILVAAVLYIIMLIVHTIKWMAGTEHLSNDTYKVMYQAERSDQDANTTLDQRVSGYNLALNENLVGAREFPTFWEPSMEINAKNLTNTSAAVPVTATVASAVPAPAPVVSPFRGGVEHLEDKTTSQLVKSLQGN